MLFGAIGRPVLVHGYKEDTASVYASSFVVPVLGHTAELLTILKWADRAVGDEEPYGEHGTGRAPAGMSVAMVSVPADNFGFDDNSSTNAGSEGLAAQLAYKAWVVLIAGLWERFRKRTSLHRRADPFPYGLQTPLYGDWQKIRNDVLKNNGVAKHSSRCEILKWFGEGETIYFKLDHVLEFLHHMGHPMRSYMLMAARGNSTMSDGGWSRRTGSCNAGCPRRDNLLGESCPRYPWWRKTRTARVATRRGSA